MPTSEISFESLITRLKGGDPAAAERIFHHFAQRLVHLAQKHLDVRLQRKVDAEDVLQSVFKSFFVRQAAGKFEIENWESLWGILTVITLRKCGRKAETFGAACRDIWKEQAPTAEGSWEACSREPTPEEAAMLSETLGQLMANLEPLQQEILALRLQGDDIAEISAKIGRTERTVQRALAHVRDRLIESRNQ